MPTLNLAWTISGNNEVIKREVQGVYTHVLQDREYNMCQKDYVVNNIRKKTFMAAVMKKNTTVNTTRTWPCIWPVHGRVHDPVHGLCTQSCTRGHGFYTAMDTAHVHSRVHDRVDGRVWAVYMAVYTASVYGGVAAMYAVVYMYTRPIYETYRICNFLKLL